MFIDYQQYILKETSETGNTKYENNKNGKSQNNKQGQQLI